MFRRPELDIGKCSPICYGDGSNHTMGLARSASRALYLCKFHLSSLLCHRSSTSRCSILVRAYSRSISIPVPRFSCYLDRFLRRKWISSQDSTAAKHRRRLRVRHLLLRLLWLLIGLWRPRSPLQQLPPPPLPALQPLVVLLRAATEHSIATNSPTERRFVFSSRAASIMILRCMMRAVSRCSCPLS